MYMAGHYIRKHRAKIERYHRSMKNVVKLDNYYHPEQLTDAIKQFVQYYNHKRYNESLNNLTPPDVYYGRGELVLKERERIKQISFERRRKCYLKHKANLSPENRKEPLFNFKKLRNTI